MNDNERLAERLIKGGWDCLKEGTYPRPYLWNWLENAHPEILKEFQKWFDENVRLP